jgi:hypothetical protein
VAGIPLDRAVLAEVLTTLGSIPIAEYATPSTKELPQAVRKYIKAHDGMLLANHGALTGRRRSLRRVLQDGDDRALREDQPRRADARARNLLSREEVTRLQELRGTTASRRRRRFASRHRPGVSVLSADQSYARSCRRALARDRARSRTVRSMARPMEKFG